MTLSLILFVSYFVPTQLCLIFVDFVFFLSFTFRYLFWLCSGFANPTQIYSKQFLDLQRVSQIMESNVYNLSEFSHIIELVSFFFMNFVIFVSLNVKKKYRFCIWWFFCELSFLKCNVNSHKLKQNETKWLIFNSRLKVAINS